MHESLLLLRADLLCYFLREPVCNVLGLPNTTKLWKVRDSMNQEVDESSVPEVGEAKHRVHKGMGEASGLKVCLTQLKY